MIIRSHCFLQFLIKRKLQYQPFSVFFESSTSQPSTVEWVNYDGKQLTFSYPENWDLKESSDTEPFILISDLPSESFFSFFTKRKTLSNDKGCDQKKH